MSALSTRTEWGPYRSVIHAVFEEWCRRIWVVLERAVESGEMRKGTDPEAMARHVVATVDWGLGERRDGEGRISLLAPHFIVLRGSRREEPEACSSCRRDRRWDVARS